MAILLFSFASVADAQISVGIRIGAPPRARVERAVRAPGPGYIWVPGYYYPVGSRYTWHQGYWTLPPYAGAAWIAPRYEGGMFYQGYWEGGGRRLEHNHAWDKDAKRRDRDRDDHDRH